MRKEIIVHKNPKSPISEIFRTLRTNIQFMNRNGNARTILITSTFAGEGKTWISANLAVTFAQTGKKVLLIDADMRKGRQYVLWGISPTPGLSNYLSGIDKYGNDNRSNRLSDFVEPTEIENLDVLPAGNVPPNPSELLISEKMIELLNDAKRNWDIVIIDGTPSQLVTDSLILARIVDSTVIVTACEETKKEDLKRVINNLKNVGGKIAGVVLNKVNVSTKKYTESYYYYGSSNNFKDNRHHQKHSMNSKFNKKKVSNKNFSEDIYNLNKLNLQKNNKEKEDNVITVNKADELLDEINKYIDNNKNNNVQLK